MTLAQLAKLGQDGQSWYVDAGKHFRKVCRQKGWDYRRFIHVLAITSVRSSLKKNLNLASAVMEGRKVPMLPVIKIALAHYEKTGVIRGLKTSAFARALLGDVNAVVIDIWMERALQSPFPPNTPRRYKILATKVLRAARRAQIPPAQYQAMVWCGSLRKKGRKATTYQEVMK